MNANDIETSRTPNSGRLRMTFALFAYNQESFVREAAEGALSQTYSSLEIILSDDCSTDRTFAIMQEMARQYSRPNHVVVRRNPENLGVVGHVNSVFHEASGDWLVLAAGDDISHRERTQRLYHALKL